MTAIADFAMIGLGVMGQNLVLNMADHGFSVAVYNRTAERTREFAIGPAGGTTVIPTFSLEELIGTLSRPRRVMMLVKAGAPVDAIIEQLIPLLDPGDVIIDGGNSLYTDTIRRVAKVQTAGLLFVGTGISGGEQGARHGPSLMPGGSPEAWPLIKEVFQAIAAKLDDGTPCCDWIGAGGAGHYVKMVHNGIEYGDMQLIAEAYQLMGQGLGMTADEMAETFASWNEEKLRSYLVEITAAILRFRIDGRLVLDDILDAAGQKGTGKWTVVSSMELGAPVSLVAEAVYARIVSSLIDDRIAAAPALTGPEGGIGVERAEFVADIRAALYASKIVSYAQGFMLLAQAAVDHEWNLDFAMIASVWRNGTIIRSTFLDEIRRAYAAAEPPPNLMLDPYFGAELAAAQDGWRRVVAEAARCGIPAAAYASALFFYDGYRSARLPANLIQAQRDFFGAHTYERIDRPRGEFFHTDWTGTGGTATAGSYQA